MSNDLTPIAAESEHLECAVEPLECLRTPLACIDAIGAVTCYRLDSVSAGCGKLLCAEIVGPFISGIVIPKNVIVIRRANREKIICVRWHFTKDLRKEKYIDDRRRIGGFLVVVGDDPVDITSGAVVLGSSSAPTNG